MTIVYTRKFLYFFSGISLILLITESFYTCKSIQVLQIIMIIIALVLEIELLNRDSKKAFVFNIVFLAMVIWDLCNAKTAYLFLNHWSLYASILAAVIYTLIGIVILYRREKHLRSAILLLVLVFASAFTAFNILLPVIDAELDFHSRDMKYIEVESKGYTQAFTFITTYDFYITFSTDNKQNLMLKVPYDDYKDISEGQLVKVSYGRGLLKQPYYLYKDDLYIEPYKESLSPITTKKDEEFLDFLETENRL